LILNLESSIRRQIRSTIEPRPNISVGELRLISNECRINRMRTRVTIAADDELDHDHDEFDSFVVPLPEIDDPSTLSSLVSATAGASGVLRIKGFAAVRGKPMRLIVQAVGPRVTCHYDRAWSAAETRETRLVVIGLKGIDRAAVTRMLSG